MTQKRRATKNINYDDEIAKFKQWASERGYALLGPNDWRLIVQRYRLDKEIADMVPRELIYFDIGVLCAAIEQQEQIIELLNGSIGRSEEEATLIRFAMPSSTLAMMCGISIVRSSRVRTFPAYMRRNQTSRSD